jgi:hypothetical protein
MSNPTSNFGWQMPTATDLVTDLPADFEVFGQAVDTALMDLKGGTINQVLAKNSNTDMDFKWVTDATGMTNPMTTTGDTIYSSSGSTPARLAIGSTGNVLTVAAGVPTWAAPAGGGVSGLTLLNSGGTSLSGASTSVSGISSKNVVYVYINGVTVSSGTSTVRFRLNGSSTSADYIANINGIQSNPSYSSNFNEQGQQGNNPDGFRTFLTSDNTSSTGGGSILIFGADTTNNKACLIQGYATGAGGNYQTATNGSGLFTPASAISSITVSCNSTFTAGTMYVYTSA